MSKYHEIYKDLLGKITDRTYLPGTKLPGEFELMRIYSSSRDTIRKSLSLLAQNGYIHKAKGSGSIVLETDTSFSTLYDLSGFGSCTGSEDVLKPKSLSLEKIIPPQKIRDILGLSEEEHCWLLKRVWYFGRENTPVIFQTDYISCPLVPVLTKEISEGSMYSFLETENGLKISYARQDISCRQPSEEEIEHLKVSPSSVIIDFETRTFLEDSRMFQYSLAGCRPDHFRFRHFARRIKKA